MAEGQAVMWKHILLFLLAFVCIKILPVEETELLRKPPELTIAIVGEEEVELPCSTNDTKDPVDWRRKNSLTSGFDDLIVQGGKVWPVYLDRYSVRNETKEDYHLVIKNVKFEDGGTYQCLDDGGFGRCADGELIVMGILACKINHSPRSKLIAGRIEVCDLDLPVDDVIVDCTLVYRGNVPPKITFKTSSDEAVKGHITNWQEDDTGDRTTGLLVRSVLQIPASRLVHGETITVQVLFPSFPNFDLTTLRNYESLIWTSHQMEMFYARIKNNLSNIGCTVKPQSRGSRDCGFETNIDGCRYKWRQNHSQYVCQATCQLREAMCQFNASTAFRCIESAAEKSNLSVFTSWGPLVCVFVVSMACLVLLFYNKVINCGILIYGRLCDVQRRCQKLIRPNRRYSPVDLSDRDVTGCGYICSRNSLNASHQQLLQPLELLQPCSIRTDLAWMEVDGGHFEHVLTTTADSRGKEELLRNGGENMKKVFSEEPFTKVKERILFSAYKWKEANDGKVSFQYHHEEFVHLLKVCREWRTTFQRATFKTRLLRLKQPDYRRRLKNRHHVELLKDAMEYDYGLDTQLISLEVLSPEQSEKIESLRNLPSALNTELINMIVERDDIETYEKFMTALATTYQEHLVLYIRKYGRFKPDEENRPLSYEEILQFRRLWRLLVHHLYSNIDEVLRIMLSTSCISLWHYYLISEEKRASVKVRQLLEVIKRRCLKHYKVFLISLGYCNSVFMCEDIHYKNVHSEDYRKILKLLEQLAEEMK